ncbi:unnamed protein product [Caenorhabditis bovis]|uniref:Calponin-homology (CH) domain-containing protein n=1 Tax=Caenorhabditis bovis TaxID=2654633 RepID=A0A8S1F112_9PELO|nr:unnamed protein product [Caenorhabditis bovis]
MEIAPFMPISSANGDSIKIYTDWANKHLSKSSNYRAIRDISNDFRDYRLVSQLINVIVPINENSVGFNRRIAKTTSNLDGLEACLDYLKTLGLDCSKLTKSDIDSGNLGAVLQLLYILSTYKQKLRQLKKDQKKAGGHTAIMPPSVSKLPSPAQRSANNSNFLTSTMPSSRLLPPTRMSRGENNTSAPAAKTTTTTTTATTTPSAAKASRGSGIKPPTSSALRSLSRGSGNNNAGSTVSSSKSLNSSTYTSIASSISPTPPTKIAPPAASRIKASASKTAPPTQKTTPNKAMPAKPAEKTAGMLKLRLINHNNNNNNNNNNDANSLQKPPAAPATSATSTPKSAIPPPRSGLRPPTGTSSKIAKKSAVSDLTLGNCIAQLATETPITFRKPPPVATMTLIEDKKTKSIAIDEENLKSKQHENKDLKRCSKASEDDSAYAGFSSTSPASSTEGSLSMHSAASSSSKGDDKSPSSDDLTLNASIVTTIRTSVEEKPILAVKGIKMNQETEGVKSAPTVGIVSPMTQKKFQAEPKSIQIDGPPLDEKEKLIMPVDEPKSPIVPPQMAPIRHPPTYEQLLRQGKIQSPPVKSLVDEYPKYQPIEAKSLDRKFKKPLTDGPIESGVAMLAKMKEKFKEYDEMTRRAQAGYPDNFEDSSSLSSGISDNVEFDDISTDDLSGVNMTALTSEYSHFVRTNNRSKSSRPSTSVDSRSRTIAEQENIHKLLSQCRTSQRSAATSSASSSSYGHYSLKSPGYATHLSVSDSMSPRRPSSSLQRQNYGGGHSGAGFHSLDRKCHLQEYSDQNSRVAALLSPRRIPNTANSKHTYDIPPAAASLNASGMSRSMILFESLSPRLTPRQRRRSPSSRSSVSTSRRTQSPRAPSSARMPLSIASPVHLNSKGSQSARTRNYDGFQLYRLADDKIPPGSSRASDMGSQLSLASTTAYATLNEKYESAIRDMTRDLECYKNTIEDLTKKQENYGMLFEMFDNKLRKLTQHIEKSNLKAEEVARFRQDLAHLRDISTHLAASAPHQYNEGAGELLRQPSLESVASHRSTMSSSSKCSSKPDKISLNSFGKNKKSWAFGVDSQIRSSLSKLTKKKAKHDHDGLPSISGSQGNGLDVIELKQELQNRDSTLAEVRLDALDRARELQELKETINKLKYENKQLKKEMDRITTGPTRASSHASLPHEEEPIYEMACSSTSNSASSKRSSGCNSIKVTVNVDLAGEISSIVCPDNEIIVGFLAMPTGQTTWQEIDQQILVLFESYLKRIDVEHHLDLNGSDGILGYQIGEVKRVIGDSAGAKAPVDVLQPTTTIRMFMKGAGQNRVDSLVLDTLLPRQMILQLVKYLFAQRRLVLAGAAGIGKSKLAKAIATYLALRNKQKIDEIVDIKIPDDSTEELLKVERTLEKILQSKTPCIVVLDNIPKNRIAFVASVFANVPLRNDEGPFVVCTVNRYQIPEMQIHQNFKMFLLTNRMEGVSGFMSRFLRRRAVEAEYRQCRQTPSELIQIIQFLPEALQAVNQFIEKTNSIDVTIGPRVFLQCPLSIDESRQWFVRLWNENFIPYMERVAREGKKTFGRCSTFDDPTEFVCEKWPWLDGAAPEETLKRLALHDLTPSAPNKPQFNPLESLIQLHATKHASSLDNTI